MMYNKLVEDCFFLPRHVGILDVKAPLTAHFGSSQKDQSRITIDLYLQCTENSLITKACFKARGNPYVIAALEWLCRSVVDRALEELGLIDYQVLIEKLEMPHNQYPVALLVKEVSTQVFILMKKKIEDHKS